MPLDIASLDLARYRPIVQWVWDDDPTDAVIDQQLTSLKKAGFGGTCIQPMPDDFRPKDFRRRMKTPYLSDAFFEMIRKAVDKSAELGLIVWLYDEGGWPSGQATGRVLQGHPHLEGQTLVQEAGRFIVERTGLPDALSRPAMDRFMQLTHEGYRKVVGEHFGKTIEAMFSDELKVPGMVGTDRIPWCEDMPRQFHQRTGYELAPVLGLLFEGALARSHPRAKVTQVRSDFSNVWMQLFLERYISPQQDWCRKHGLLFNGHLAGDHDLARHPAIFGDYMRVMRHFDMPGVDTIWRQIWPGHQADFPLLAGSARAIHKRQFAMSETGAVYGRDLTITQLKWLCDHQIIRGVNRFTLMNLPVSGDDVGNISALTTEGLAFEAHEPWAKHVALASALASAGKPGETCAVLYPGTDLLAAGGDGPGTAAQAIVHELIKSPAGCMYVDEEAILAAAADIKADDLASITCGHATFHTIVIAGQSLISPELARALSRLAKAGLRIIAVGEALPYWIGAHTAVHELSCAKLMSFDDLRSDPQAIGMASGSTPLFEADPLQVRASHRVGDDWQLLLLSNESSTPARVKLHLPEQGVRCAVDTDLVEQDTIAANDVLSLEPGQVIAIMTGHVNLPTSEKPSPALSHATDADDWKLIEAVTCQGHHLDVATLAHLPVFGAWEASLGRYFSGELTWRTTLDWPSENGAAGKSLALDLGDVEHIAVVTVNGQRVGCRSFRPWRFDLTPYLTQGENDIRVTIANTPANAIWEPDYVAHLKSTGQWNIYNTRMVERCTPALDGGWYGPAKWLA